MASYPPFQQPITAKAGQIDNPSWRLFFVRIGEFLAGAVTHTTGVLANSHLVVGNGAGDIRTLPSLGSATTVLHGNAGGDPSFSAVDLVNDVGTSRLLYANFTQALAASHLLGRGSAAGAGDWQDITLGSGLTMTGTTLSATTSTPSVDFTATFLLMGA